MPTHPGDGGVKSVSKFEPESRSMFLIPVERLENVSPGFLS